jgi:HNH endonuclease
MLTHARLKQLLDYDPETGVFTRLVGTDHGRHKAGTVSGCSSGRYREQWVDGVRYAEHRLAWFWMTGEWPSCQIDHENLDKKDNRWANLREANVSQNAMNRAGRSSSGAKGVYFIKSPEKCGSKRWKASIAKGGQSRHLGNFHTREDAQAAYQAAAASLHGEFARVA